jgi:Flp pilus assembly protein protease CpaA
MTFIYENILSVIFISSGLLVLFRFENKIPNYILLLLVIAMPIAGLASGMQPMEIGGQFLIGFAALVFSLLLFVKLHFGGAAAKVFSISMLWIPLYKSIYVILFSYFCLIFLYWVFQFFSKTILSENIMVGANHAALFLIIVGVLVFPGFGMI